MTTVDLSTIYVIINKDGTIHGADTDLLTAMEAAWDSGNGWTAIPLSRVHSVGISATTLTGLSADKQRISDQLFLATGTKMTAPDFEVFYAEVKKLIINGQKIVAIKETRANTVAGLAQAKAFIDWLCVQTLP